MSSRILRLWILSALLAFGAVLGWSWWRGGEAEAAGSAVVAAAETAAAPTAAELCARPEKKPLTPEQKAEVERQIEELEKQLEAPPGEHFGKLPPDADVTTDNLSFTARWKQTERVVSVHREFKSRMS